MSGPGDLHFQPLSASAQPARTNTAIRNERDAAIEWLDRAYAQKDEDLYRIEENPLFWNVARGARYKAFLRKMKLPE